MANRPFDAGAQLCHAVEFKRDNPELFAFIAKLRVSRTLLRAAIAARDDQATTKEFGYLVDVAVTLGGALRGIMVSLEHLQDNASAENKPLVDRATDAIVKMIETGKPGDESYVAIEPDIEG